DAAETAVGGGDQAAEHHQQRTRPDPAHERLDVHAQRPGAAAERLTEGDVQVAGEAALDLRLGEYLAAAGVGAFFRMHQYQWRAVGEHLHGAVVGAVVRSLALLDAIETERI